MDIKGWRGSVSYDGQTVTVRKTLRGEVTFAVGAITSVEISRAGVGLRQIRFSVAGGSERGRQTAFGSPRQAGEDPYALPFRPKQQAQFEQLRSAVLASR